MNRSQMIEALLEHESHPVTGARDGAFQRSRREFERLSDRALERELSFRGLVNDDEPESFEADEDLAEADLMVLLSGMVGRHVPLRHAE